jgi:hypothetical protein
MKAIEYKSCQDSNSQVPEYLGIALPPYVSAIVRRSIFPRILRWAG